MVFNFVHKILKKKIHSNDIMKFIGKLNNKSEKKKKQFRIYGVNFLTCDGDK